MKDLYRLGPGGVLAESRPDQEHHDPVHGRVVPRARRRRARPLRRLPRRRHRGEPALNAPDVLRPLSSPAAHPVDTLGSMSSASASARRLGNDAEVDARDDARRARRRPRAPRPVRAPGSVARASGAIYRMLAEPLHPEVRARLAARGIPDVLRAPGGRHRRAAEPGGAWSSPPAPRRASRSVTRCRSSVESSTTVATPRCCCSRPRRSPRTSCGPCARGSSPGCAPSPTTATPPATTGRWARKNANVVLTNPEMLHMGILPSHKRWATFLMRLQYVVVDELHTLRGHLRLARRARAAPAAPAVRALRLATRRSSSRARRSAIPASSRARCAAARSTRSIDDGVAAAPSACLACWQRPLLDAHSGARGSANIETAELLTRFVRAGHQTLAFTRSRRGAEVVAQYAAGALQRCRARARRPRRGVPGRLPPRGTARSSSSTCRAVELLGIAATNALELGIDIGGLDAVVLNGFPGTLASMWQQAGRAGRTGRRSAAVLVAGDDQLDQWYARPSDRAHTARAGTGGREPAEPLHHRAPRSRARRTRCRSAPTTTAGSATRSRRRRARARARRPARAARRADVLGRRSRPPPARSACAADRRSSTGWSTPRANGSSGPSTTPVSSRSRTRERCTCIREGSIASITSTVDEHVAWLDPCDDADEYTQARTTTDITIVSEDAFAALGDAIVHLGSVEVRNQVVAFQRKQVSTNSVIEVCDARSARASVGHARRAGTRCPPTSSRAPASLRPRWSALCTPPNTD